MHKIPKLFLSYAHEDRLRVTKIYEALRSEGFSVWMDSKNLLPGQEWGSQIKNALDEAEIILIFISNNSISKRGYFQRELKVALDIASTKPNDKVFLIPVRLDNLEIPQVLSHIQYADVFTQDDLNRLVQQLQQHLLQDEISLKGFQLIKEKINIENRENEKKKRPKIFVAMPFDVKLEDVYHYGIYRAADANGYECIRVDMKSFTGDILQQIKNSIELAVAVIAELSGENPNVHLELGYAWGKKIPTILLLPESQQLCFDVRGQKCLMYNSIISLETELTTELYRLKMNGDIKS